MSDHDGWTGVADVAALTALLGEPTELDEYYGPSYAENIYRTPGA